MSPCVSDCWLSPQVALNWHRMILRTCISTSAYGIIPFATIADRPLNWVFLAALPFIHAVTPANQNTMVALESSFDAQVFTEVFLPQILWARLFRMRGLSFAFGSSGA